MVLSGLFSGSKVLLMYLFHSRVSFSSGMLNSFRISCSMLSVTTHVLITSLLINTKQPQIYTKIQPR